MYQEIIMSNVDTLSCFGTLFVSGKNMHTADFTYNQCIVLGTSVCLVLLSLCGWSNLTLQHILVSVVVSSEWVDLYEYRVVCHQKARVLSVNEIKKFFPSKPNSAWTLFHRFKLPVPTLFLYFPLKSMIDFFRPPNSTICVTQRIVDNFDNNGSTTWIWLYCDGEKSTLALWKFGLLSFFKLVLVVTWSNC